MLEDEYPKDPLGRRSYGWVEKQVIRYASSLVFTTESTKQMYLNRYPELSSDRCLVITNGYDEEDFKGIFFSENIKSFGDRPIRLLHSGLIYPEERDPRPFFRALARLKKENRIDSIKLKVDLRASGSESYYSEIIRDLGIDDIVHLLPSLPYREAIKDCGNADGLLLLQAASCNHLIPARVYEYLRLRKPILALTANRSETAMLLEETGGATCVDLSNEEAIFLKFSEFLSAVREGKHPLPDPHKIRNYARGNQARDLVRCLVLLNKPKRMA